MAVDEGDNKSGLAWMLFPATDEGLGTNECAYRLLPVPFEVTDVKASRPDVEVTLVGGPQLLVRNVGPVDDGYVSAEVADPVDFDRCDRLAWKQAVIRMSLGRGEGAPSVKLFEPKDFERMQRFGESPAPWRTESVGASAAQ